MQNQRTCGKREMIEPILKFSDVSDGPNILEIAIVSSAKMGQVPPKRYCTRQTTDGWGDDKNNTQLKPRSAIRDNWCLVPTRYAICRLNESTCGPGGPDQYAHPGYECRWRVGARRESRSTHPLSGRSKKFSGFSRFNSIWGGRHRQRHNGWK